MHTTLHMQCTSYVQGKLAKDACSPWEISPFVVKYAVNGK